MLRIASSNLCNLSEILSIAVEFNSISLPYPSILLLISLLIFCISDAVSSLIYSKSAILLLNSSISGISFDSDGICNYCHQIKDLEHEYQTGKIEGLKKLKFTLKINFVT